MEAIRLLASENVAVFECGRRADEICNKFGTVYSELGIIISLPKVSFGESCSGKLDGEKNQPGENSNSNLIRETF